MDFNWFEIIQQYLQISVVLICLFVGYIIASIWVDMSSGVGVTLDTIVTRLASGLASTGMYELLHQLITQLPKLNEEEAEEEPDVTELKGDHFADN